MRALSSALGRPGACARWAASARAGEMLVVPLFGSVRVTIGGAPASGAGVAHPPRSTAPSSAAAQPEASGLIIVLSMACRAVPGVDYRRKSFDGAAALSGGPFPVSLIGRVPCGIGGRGGSRRGCRGARSCACSGRRGGRPACARSRRSPRGAAPLGERRGILGLPRRRGCRARRRCRPPAASRLPAAGPRRRQAARSDAGWSRP